jgi:hypothetical protein
MLSEKFHELMDKAWPIAEAIEGDRSADQRSRLLAQLVTAMNKELCEGESGK